MQPALTHSAESKIFARRISRDPAKAPVAHSAGLQESKVGTVHSLDALRQRHLIAEYQPLVERIVRKTLARAGFCCTADELRSAGWLGLLEAVRRFDSRRGIPFEAFAQHRVTGAILDEIRTRDRLPRPSRRRARGLEAARQKLTRKLNREPLDSEIARAAGEDLETFHKRSARERAQAILRLDDLPTDGWEHLFADDGPSVLEALCDHERVSGLNTALRSLPERTQRILALYYGEELSYREIGAELGVCESRICQLIKGAQAQLRERLVAFA